MIICGYTFLLTQFTQWMTLAQVELRFSAIVDHAGLQKVQSHLKICQNCRLAMSFVILLRFLIRLSILAILTERWLLFMQLIVQVQAQQP